MRTKISVLLFLCVYVCVCVCVCGGGEGLCVLFGLEANSYQFRPMKGTGKIAGMQTSQKLS